MKRSPAPVAADAARDMTSGGADAFSGTAVGPRAVLEPAVGASPDDASEGHSLNLVINNFSPSEVSVATDMRISACSTSACRGGVHDLASTPTPADDAPTSFASVSHGVVLEVLAP